MTVMVVSTIGASMTNDVTAGGTMRLWSSESNIFMKRSGQGSSIIKQGIKTNLIIFWVAA